MARLRVRNLILAAAISGLWAGAVGAQTAQSKKTPSALTPGGRLYKQNCALCHGNDGKGNGRPPASSPFKDAPPDLTTLAKRHDGNFPDAYVTGVLRNGVKLPDHGPAEMPVWGPMFKSMSKSDESQATQRIADLLSYLKSIQMK